MRGGGAGELYGRPDSADRAAGHDAAEMFGFLLGHEVLVRIA